MDIANYKRTKAVVRKVLDDDGGFMFYFVRFFDEGKEVVAETSYYYITEGEWIDIGDEVEIGYFYPKKGTPRAVIFDERLKPISSGPHVSKFIVVFGIIFFCVGTYLAIKALVF